MGKGQVVANVPQHSSVFIIKFQDEKTHHEAMQSPEYQDIVSRIGQLIAKFDGTMIVKTTK